jgi:hypothetical protein
MTREQTVFLAQAIDQGFQQTMREVANANPDVSVDDGLEVLLTGVAMMVSRYAFMNADTPRDRRLIAQRLEPKILKALAMLQAAPAGKQQEAKPS